MLHLAARVSCVVLALISVSRAADERMLAGRFDGVVELPGQPLTFDVDWRTEQGAFSGDLSIPAQGAQDLELADLVVEGSNIRFKLAGIPGDPTFEGTVASDFESVRGTFRQGGSAFPFTLTKAGAGAAAARRALLTFATDVEAARAALHVPACAVVVVKDGEVVFAQGFGQRDVERNLPATTQTLFAIGSSTKAFTTFVLGKLVEEGKLAWDEPVTNWIPEFRVKDKFASERMTPRDLVTHRSGLPRHDRVWYATELSRAEMVKSIAVLEPSTDFRTTFQYNNLMFLTAGYLTERVTNHAWEDEVRARVFEPLGMRRANFSVLDSQRDADHALPYEWKKGAIARMNFRNITNVGPAGAINASVDDMARWVLLHLSNGTLDGKAIASQSTVDELHIPRMPTGDTPELGADVQSVGYALGWFVDDYRGVRRVHHGGNIDGFSALVALVPDRKLGLVVLTNLNGTDLCSVVERMAIDRVCGLETKPWADKSAAALARADQAEVAGEAVRGATRHAGTQPSHALAAFAGTFTHAAYGSILIEMDGDHLVATMRGVRSPLNHWHYDVFEFAKNAADPSLDEMQLQFVTNFAGDVDALRIPFEPAVLPIEFARAPDAVLADAAYVAKFAGEYAAIEMNVKVVAQGASLTLIVPEQPHYPLEPLWNDTFGLKALKGFTVKFVVGADGAVKEAVFSQPGGVFIAQRK